MKTTTLYRLQRTNGWGVYHNPSAVVNMDDAEEGKSAKEMQERIEACLHKFGWGGRLGMPGGMRPPEESMVSAMLGMGEVDKIRKLVNGRRPSPEDEELRRIKAGQEDDWWNSLDWSPVKVKFAFANLDQLAHWFDVELDADDWEAMRKAKVVLEELVVNCDDVRILEHQAIYRPEGVVSSKDVPLATAWEYAYAKRQAERKQEQKDAAKGSHSRRSSRRGKDGHASQAARSGTRNAARRSGPGRSDGEEKAQEA